MRGRNSRRNYNNYSVLIDFRSAWHCRRKVNSLLSRERPYLRKNSIENHITTIISITNNRAIAWSSYSWIVEKTLKAKHVNTIKKLKIEIVEKILSSANKQPDGTLDDYNKWNVQDESRSHEKFIASYQQHSPSQQTR